MADNSDWTDGPDIKPPKEGWYINNQGEAKIDEAAAFKPVQPIPAGMMSEFDNPLKPLNVPNASTRDLQKGVKQFEFATKGDVEDTATVLAKNRGIQLRTGSGNTDNRFSMQYSPDDPNSFGYQQRFMFMKDPVNHYTEAPAFVTETDGMVYEKKFLASDGVKDFTILPKRSVPTKDSGSATTSDRTEQIDSELEGRFGPDGESTGQDPLRTRGTETPKDLTSMGDEQKRAISNFQNMIDNEDSKWFPKFDPSIMDKDVSDPALRGTTSVEKFKGRIEPMKPKKK